MISDSSAVQPMASTRPTAPSPYKDARTLLPLLAIISFAILVLVPVGQMAYSKTQAYLARRRQPILLPEDDLSDDDEPVVLVPPPTAAPRIMPAYGGGFVADLREHVATLGGDRIFALNFVRFLGCFALLALTIAAVVVDSERSAPAEPHTGIVHVLHKGKGKKKHGKGGRGRKERQREEFGREEWVEIGQCIFFLYATLLALLTLTVRKVQYVNRQIKPHLVILLLFAFGLYAGRNLVPLALHRQPLDISLHRGKGGDGWASLVWWRVGLLGLVGAVVPLALLAIQPSSFSLLVKGRAEGDESRDEDA